MELIDSLFLKKSQIPWTLIFLVMIWGSIAECKAQAKSVKSVFNKSLSSPDLTSIPVKKIQSLQEVQDIEKLKSDFYSINEKSKELKKLLSDSTFYAQHKDSINAVVKSHLEDQQQLIQEQASNLSDGIEQNMGINQDDLIPSNLNDIHTANDYKALFEKLNAADLDFQQQMEEMLPEVFQMEQLEVLSARISDVDYGNYESYLTEVTELESKLMEDGKTSALSRINRKVGFEQIAYKEVVVKSEVLKREHLAENKLKLGVLYSLNEGISFNSLIQGNVAYQVFPSFYSILGVSFKATSKNNRDYTKSGYGGYLGFRKYVLNDWFFQGVLEHNYLDFNTMSSISDLNFKGFTSEMAISIGKEIKLSSRVNNIIQIDYTPLFERERSLHGNMLQIKVGLLYNVIQ
ncbi:hypothetical protein ACFOUP_12295 [Belliella kenyensis]|uniref:Outer membrane protein beta-barrel domain-containing protein n=1 Tax=Belliella kenyensis TaxID=1472724 RepID=A0ABV8ELE7_9BACT|nr:hypothetical protein [Belliella kenyensis]MCH7400744.1 hypothetical protein [Belliella kenyensis]MDN3601969.1 hypothetical protein [Belliella kenyensis]